MLLDTSHSAIRDPNKADGNSAGVQQLYHNHTPQQTSPRLKWHLHPPVRDISEFATHLFSPMTIPAAPTFPPATLRFTASSYVTSNPSADHPIGVQGPPIGSGPSAKKQQSNILICSLHNARLPAACLPLPALPPPDIPLLPISPLFLLTSPHSRYINTPSLAPVSPFFLSHKPARFFSLSVLS